MNRISRNRYRCSLWQCVLVLGVVMGVASVSSADLVDGSGTVTGWGVTPFSQAGPSSGVLGDIYYTLENNYAPIDYPSGVGHVPSPGLGAGGEAFDLEELYLRVTDTHLQVLLVTSSAYQATVGGTAFYLGDLFLTVDGRQYGVVTQSASQGLAAGGVYQIGGPDDTQILQQASRSYYGTTYLRPNDYGPDATIPDTAGPWAVSGDIDVGRLLGSALIDSATFDYGGSEDGTFLIEYSICLDLFGPTAPSTADGHVA